VLQAATVQLVVLEGEHRIDAQILLNIMQSSEESEVEIDRLAKLGHEA
jgi:hypothetical protein